MNVARYHTLFNPEPCHVPAGVPEGGQFTACPGGNGNGFVSSVKQGSKLFSIYRNPDKSDLKDMLQEAKDNFGFRNIADITVRFVRKDKDTYVFSDELIHYAAISNLWLKGDLKEGDDIEFGFGNLYKDGKLKLDTHGLNYSTLKKLAGASGGSILVYSRYQTITVNFNKCHAPAGSPEGGQFCETEDNFVTSIKEHEHGERFYPSYKNPSKDDIKEIIKDLVDKFGRDRVIRDGLHYGIRIMKKGKDTYVFSDNIIHQVALNDFVKKGIFKIGDTISLGNGEIEEKRKIYDYKDYTTGKIVRRKYGIDVSTTEVPQGIFKYYSEKETATVYFNKCHQPSGSKEGGQFCETEDNFVTSVNSFDGTYSVFKNPNKDDISSIKKEGMTPIIRFIKKDNDSYVFSAMTAHLFVAKKLGKLKILKPGDKVVAGEAVALDKKMQFRDCYNGRVLRDYMIEPLRYVSKLPKITSYFNPEPCHVPAGSPEGGQFIACPGEENFVTAIDGENSVFKNPSRSDIRTIIREVKTGKYKQAYEPMTEIELRFVRKDKDRYVFSSQHTHEEVMNLMHNMKILKLGDKLSTGYGWAEVKTGVEHYNDDYLYSGVFSRDKWGFYFLSNPDAEWREKEAIYSIITTMFNKCHNPPGSPEGGKFCETEGSEGRIVDARKSPIKEKELDNWPDDGRLDYGLSILEEEDEDDSSILALKGKEGINALASYYEKTYYMEVALLATRETGHGYGRKMMQEISRRAAEKGKGVQLIGTPEARGFYQKIGMREVMKSTGIEGYLFRFNAKEAEKFAKRKFSAKETIKAQGREYTAAEIDAAEPKSGIFTVKSKEEIAIQFNPEPCHVPAGSPEGGQFTACPGEPEGTIKPDDSIVLGKPETWINAVKKQFGTTKDIVEAGWLLPNGEMIRLSEKESHAVVSHLLPDKQRQSLPKLQVNPTTLFTQETGSIRMLLIRDVQNENKTDFMFELAHKPTKEQYQIIKQGMDRVTGSTLFDIYKPKLGQGLLWSNEGEFTFAQVKKEIESKIRSPETYLTIITHFNPEPCHVPAGSSEGGQFTACPGARATGKPEKAKKPKPLEGVHFYHGTSSEYLESIQKYGLIPHKARGADYWAELHHMRALTQAKVGDRTVSVYVTHNFTTAEYFANLAASVSKAEPVILRVVIPKAYQNRIRPDEHDNEGFRFKGKIEPEWITGEAVTKPRKIKIGEATKDEVFYIVALVDNGQDLSLHFNPCHEEAGVPEGGQFTSCPGGGISTQGKEWIKQAKEKMGVTDSYYEAGFLLPDGEMLDLKKRTKGYEHSRLSKVLGIKGGFMKFMEETGSIRMYVTRGPDFEWVSLHFIEGRMPTKEQMSTLSQLVIPGNKVAVDVSSKGHRWLGSFELGDRANIVRLKKGLEETLSKQKPKNYSFITIHFNPEPCHQPAGSPEGGQFTACPGGGGGEEKYVTSHWSGDAEYSIFKDPDASSLKTIIKEGIKAGFHKDLSVIRFIETEGLKYVFSAGLVHTEAVNDLIREGIFKPGDKVAYGMGTIEENQPQFRDVHQGEITPSHGFYHIQDLGPVAQERHLYLVPQVLVNPDPCHVPAGSPQGGQFITCPGEANLVATAIEPYYKQPFSIFRNPDADDVRTIVRERNDAMGNKIGRVSKMYKGNVGVRYIEKGKSKYVFSNELIHSQGLSAIVDAGKLKAGDRIFWGHGMIKEGRNLTLTRKHKGIVVRSPRDFTIHYYIHDLEGDEKNAANYQRVMVYYNPDPCHVPAGVPEGGQFTACPGDARRTFTEEDVFPKEYGPPPKGEQVAVIRQTHLKPERIIKNPNRKDLEKITKWQDDKSKVNYLEVNGNKFVFSKKISHADAVKALFEKGLLEVKDRLKMGGGNMIQGKMQYADWGNGWISQDALGNISLETPYDTHPLNVVRPHDIRLWHGTAGTYVDSIKEKGLIPRYEKGGDYWAKKNYHITFAQDGDRKNSVFFATSLGPAAMMAELIGEETNSYPAIIKVEIPAKYKSMIKPDTKSKPKGSAVMFTGKIEPEWIKEVVTAYEEEGATTLYLVAFVDGQEDNVESYSTIRTNFNPDPCHVPAGSPEGGQFTACPGEETGTPATGKQEFINIKGNVMREDIEDWVDLQKLYGIEAIKDVNGYRDYTGFALMENGKVKGLTSMTTYGFTQPDKLYVCYLATKETGHGYGRIMMQEIARRAAAQNKGLWLDSVSSAETFYEKMGMKHTGGGTFMMSREETKKLAERKWEEKGKLKAAEKRYSAEEIDAAEPEDGIYTRNRIKEEEPQANYHVIKGKAQ